MPHKYDYNFLVFLIRLVQALAVHWKIPVLIFQSCVNYAGYVCINAFVDEYRKDPEKIEVIVPLHFSNDNYCYLERVKKDLEGEIEFNAILNSVCLAMKQDDNDDEDSLVDDIVGDMTADDISRPSRLTTGIAAQNEEEIEKNQTKVSANARGKKVVFILIFFLLYC